LRTRSTALISESVGEVVISDISTFESTCPF
jgi:hypothetical protein